MEEKCRACLSQNETLFNWNEIVAEDITFADLFFHITNLNNKKLKHQEFLCCECGLQIQEIYKFIENATAAERALRKEIKEMINNESIGENVEIALLTEEDFKDIESQTVDKQEIDSDYIPDELDEIKEESEYEDEENTAPENETQSETESDKLKFEVVNVGNEAEDSDEEYVPETEISRRNSAPKRRRVRESSQENNFVCQHCGKSYKTAANRKRHMAVHGNAEQFLCDICPRTFTDSWSLVKHKRTHDENRKRNFSCHLCGLKFLTSHTLRGHMQIHDSKREKPFKCDQCEKAFFQKGALNVHKRKHTGDMLQCEVCDKQYPREIDLELHMRSHTGEQPFKCTTCGKAFKYNSTLYDHVRKAHFGYYKCRFCSKQYKDLQALTEHMEEHENFCYKCALCNKEMAKKYRLRIHIKGVHHIENVEEMEDLIISTKTETKHRTNRKFTDVEYKNHVKIPPSNAKLMAPRRRNYNQQYVKEMSSDDN